MRSLRWRGAAALAAVVVLTSMVGASRATGRPAREHAEFTRYPVQVGDALIFAANGAWWTYDRTSVRRVDPATEALVGRPAVTMGALSGGTGPLPAGDSLWAIEPGAHGSEGCPEADAPYAAVAFDPITGERATAVQIPESCVYYADRVGSPSLATGGDLLWITQPRSSSIDFAVNRVDVTTAEVKTVPLDPSTWIAAADSRGAWGSRFVTGPTIGPPNWLGLSTVEGIQIERIDPSGSVINPDVLPTTHAIFAEVANEGGLWVIATASAPKAGRPAQVQLVHVTPSGDRTRAKGVAAWSVLAGDTGSWFLGTVGTPKLRPSGVVDWVLGRVDPRTGRVIRTIRFDLPEVDRPDATGSKHPSLVVAAVMNGEVWLAPVGAFGPNNKPEFELIRVDVGAS